MEMQTHNRAEDAVDIIELAPVSTSQLDAAPATTTTAAPSADAPPEAYRVYKQRWLLLIAIFNMILSVGLYSWFVPIANTFNEHMSITMDEYNFMTQLSMLTTVLSVLVLARAIERFGVLKMCYFTCSVIVATNCLMAVCCFDSMNRLDSTLLGYKLRYHLFLVSQMLVGLVTAITYCLPPKFARVWFASDQNSICLMLINCGYNIGLGFVYFVPKVVSEPADLRLIGYFLLAASIVSILLTTGLVTRSAPRMPPSKEAAISATTGAQDIALSLRMRVMLTSGGYAVIIATSALNDAILIVESLVLEDILKKSAYDSQFCGLLMLIGSASGIVLMIFGGYLVDRVEDKIRLSRILTFAHAIAFVMFNYCISRPNIKMAILVTNLFYASTLSLKFPAQISVMLDSSLGVLPESAVISMGLVLSQSIAPIISFLLNPSRRLFEPLLGADNYHAPLIAFSVIAVGADLMYVILFRQPDLVELRGQLRRRSELNKNQD